MTSSRKRLAPPPTSRTDLPRQLLSVFASIRRLVVYVPKSHAALGDHVGSKCDETVSLRNKLRAVMKTAPSFGDENFEGRSGMFEQSKLIGHEQGISGFKPLRQVWRNHLGETSNRRAPGLSMTSNPLRENTIVPSVFPRKSRGSRC